MNHVHIIDNVDARLIEVFNASHLNTRIARVDATSADVKTTCLIDNEVRRFVTYLDIEGDTITGGTVEAA